MKSVFYPGLALVPEVISGIMNTNGCRAVTCYARTGPGRQATGKFTVGALLAAGEAPELAAVAFTARAKYARGTAVLAGMVAGKTIGCNLIPFTAVDADPGVHEFLVGATDLETATNAAAAITAAAATTGMTAAASNLGQIDFTATVPGDAGNHLALTTNDAVIVTLSGATLAGAYDAAADEWPLGADEEESALAFAAAINLCADPAVDGVVIAEADGADVLLTAVLGGTGGNAIALTSSANVLRDAATLAGGAEASRTLTVAVLADDEATVLYTQDVVVAVSKKIPVTIGVGAASGGDLVGIPIALSNKLKLTLAANDGTQGALAAFGR